MKGLAVFFCLVAISSALVINSPTAVSDSGTVVQNAQVTDLSDASHPIGVVSALETCGNGNRTIKGATPGIYKIHPDGCMEFLTPMESRQARSVIQNAPISSGSKN